VRLEKDLDDQLDRSCGKEGLLYNAKDERNILDTTDIRKADWIGHNIRLNCLLKHVTERKIEG
jgi:hypothetical protein